MTTFPDWTGPEAVRRLNAQLLPPRVEWRWPEEADQPSLKAMQQLMVDLKMPEPKDEAVELFNAVTYPNRTKEVAIDLIRAALAKAAGGGA